MKIDMSFRYVAWDKNGWCTSFVHPPTARDVEWVPRESPPALYDNESHLFLGMTGMDGVLKGEDAMERYYDTEDEEDMKILQALVEL